MNLGTKTSKKIRDNVWFHGFFRSIFLALLDLFSLIQLNLGFLIATTGTSLRFALKILGPEANSDTRNGDIADARRHRIGSRIWEGSTQEEVYMLHNGRYTDLLGVSFFALNFFGAFSFSVFLVSTSWFVLGIFRVGRAGETGGAL